MASIIDVVPDVDTVLAFAPEELGGIFLRLVPGHMQNGMFQPANVTHHSAGKQYPGNHDAELEVAYSEAWAWLEINMLIVPATGINGNNGWKILSRRGRSISSERQFEEFRAAAAFPKALLHPSIADKVWLALARGDLDDAVFSAFKAVEVAVREVGKYAATDIGVHLMRKAFHPNTGNLTDKSQPDAERESLMHLFAGAIGSYKNPHSHRTVAITDPHEAQEMVLLASHLLGIVDSRR